MTLMLSLEGHTPPVLAVISCAATLKEATAMQERCLG